MKDFFLVFLGAGMGGMLRLAIMHLTALFGVGLSHYAVLSCNILGCFIAGLIMVLLISKENPSQFNLFLITGLAGGFTTFSAFSLDTIRLYQGSNPFDAVLYVATSLFIGLGAGSNPAGRKCHRKFRRSGIATNDLH